MEYKLEKMKGASRILKVVLMGDRYLDMGELLSKLSIISIGGYKELTGCDIGVLKLNSENFNVKFTLWDIAIDGRFRGLFSAFCKGAAGAIIYFDLEYENFLDRIPELIVKICSTKKNIPILLLGHNFDGVNESVLAKLDYLVNKIENVRYIEINSMKNIIHGFKVMASILSDNEPVENFKVALSNKNSLTNMNEILRNNRIKYRRKKDRFNRFKALLENLNYKINNKNEVEIITSKGIFIVNIIEDIVYFGPISCEDCTFHCKNRNSEEYKSLCIESKTKGWSNLDLESRDLGILSKLIAISEDRLPRHVINQINRICPKIIPPDLPPAPTPSIIPLSKLDMKPDVSEAKAMLRNYKIQFDSGRLPFSVYSALKDKYERIIKENSK